MKPKFRGAMVMLLVLGGALVGTADPARAATVKRIATIQVPDKPLASFDISWVDPATERYYLADRSNARVDVFDPEENTFVGSIGDSSVFAGFTGNNDTSGPNGIIVIRRGRELWAGDGDNTVKVFGLTDDSPQLIDTIHLGPKADKRADEMAWDPRDRIMLVATDAAEPFPYVSLISTKPSHAILAKIVFDGSNNTPKATDGIEQSVWDPKTRRFYVAVPQVNGGPNAEITVVDPKVMVVTGHFPVTGCAPHGLALGPNDQLLLGCNKGPRSVIMDAKTGTIVKEIPQVFGSDEVWFNPGDGRYYLAANRMSGGPVLGVINGQTNEFVENVSVGPPPPPVYNSHSVAAFADNNHVFVPLPPTTAAFDPNCTHGCIGVYGIREEEDDE